MLTFKKIVECIISDQDIGRERVINTTSLGTKVKITILFNLSIILKRPVMVRRIAEDMARQYKRVQLEIHEEFRALQDCTDIRNEIIEKCNDKMSANKIYNFFYDESNNYRVFRIKNRKFNESPENYFVLGGVCTKINAFPDFSQLEKELRLQPNCGELKSKKWYKGKDFYGCMNDKRLNSILKWIDQKDVFLHFEAIDHFKIIARDLCQMCCNNKEEQMICENTFYKCMKSDVECIQSILVRYEYPNIDNEKLKEFLGEFKEFVSALSAKKKIVDKIDEFGKEIFWCIPIKIIDRAIKGNIFFELRENIINNYVPYYILKPLIFLNSKHTYDDETEIEKKLKEDAFTVNGKKLKNYRFVNSVDEKMVQISDILVGVLAKFLKYVNSFEIGHNTLYSINKLRENLRTQLQRENFCLLMKILRKSKKENEFFIQIDGDYVNMNALELLLSISLVTSEKVMFRRVE